MRFCVFAVFALVDLMYNHVKSQPLFSTLSSYNSHKQPPVGVQTSLFPECLSHTQTSRASNTNINEGTSGYTPEESLQVSLGGERQHLFIKTRRHSDAGSVHNMTAV